MYTRPSPAIQRYALNMEGRLGSLYDGWKDNVLDKLYVTSYISTDNAVRPQC
jgi:hypothetical protein